MTFARKINKILEFDVIFARKMAEYYIVFARKNSLSKLGGWGGGHVPLPTPPFSTPMGTKRLCLLLICCNFRKEL